MNDIDKLYAELKDIVPSSLAPAPSDLSPESLSPAPCDLESSPPESLPSMATNLASNFVLHEVDAFLAILARKIAEGTVVKVFELDGSDEHREFEILFEDGSVGNLCVGSGDISFSGQAFPELSTIIRVLSAMTTEKVGG